MERLLVGIVTRMNSRNPRFESFLHVPHVRIPGDLLGGGLLAFRVLLFPAVFRRRRHAAKLEFQVNRFAQMLFQRRFQPVLDVLIQHRLEAGFQPQLEAIAFIHH